MANSAEIDLSVDREQLNKTTVVLIFLSIKLKTRLDLFKRNNVFFIRFFLIAADSCRSTHLLWTLGCCKSARTVRDLLNLNVPQGYLIAPYFWLLTAKAGWWCNMGFVFFLSICTGALIRAQVWQCQQREAEGAQSAPSNLMAELTIEHVGTGDQESDTTFSQIQPLWGVSNPEWWPTRLQALTPFYQYGMEASGVRPVRHVTVEGWGLNLLHGE